MNALKIFFLGLFVMGFTACQKTETFKINYDIGIYGVLYSGSGQFHPTGTHHMGDTTKAAGQAVFVSSNYQVDLDNYIGDTVMVYGDFIVRDDNSTPAFISVKFVERH